MNPLFPRRMLLVLFGATLALTACSPKPVDETAQVDPDVDLASSKNPDLSDMEMPLEASFMSDHQTFAYTFYYDGAQLVLMDGSLSGTVSIGPNFKVETGGVLVGSTSWVADVADIGEKAGASVQVGDYSVYRYEEAVDSCMKDHVVLPYGQEALHLVLTSCSGEDRTVGQAALDALLQHVEVVQL